MPETRERMGPLLVEEWVESEGPWGEGSGPGPGTGSSLLSPPPPSTKAVPGGRRHSRGWAPGLDGGGGTTSHSSGAARKQCRPQPRPGLDGL